MRTGGLGEYVIADVLDANYTSCALGGAGCIDLAAYELDELGIGATPPAAEDDLPGATIGGFDT